MILKEADDRAGAISTLGALLARGNAEQQKAIKRELGMLHAGIKEEKESAYFLGFHFKNAKNLVLIHDLRLEHNGRVAQIDHLLLTRTLDFWILETKHFSSGLKIDERDQFLRWNQYRKCYEGMPSPLEQAERHGIVLRDFISSLDWPTRAGLRLMPTLKPRVLISPDARLDLPKRPTRAAEATLKADVFMTHLKAAVDKEGVRAMLAMAAKIVAPDTVAEMARMLVACHKPYVADYAAKFGMQNTDCIRSSCCGASVLTGRSSDGSFLQTLPVMGLGDGVRKVRLLFQVPLLHEEHASALRL